MSKFIKTIQYLYDKIEHYQNLESNWDGYGATAPSKDVCDFAKKFVEFMDKNNFKIPTPQVSSHEIGFFYNNVKNDYMEMSCDEEGIETNTIWYIVCVTGQRSWGDCFILGNKESENKFLEHYKEFQEKII